MTYYTVPLTHVVVLAQVVLVALKADSIPSHSVQHQQLPACVARGCLEGVDMVEDEHVWGLQDVGLGTGCRRDRERETTQVQHVSSLVGYYMALLWGNKSAHDTHTQLSHALSCAKHPDRLSRWSRELGRTRPATQHSSKLCNLESCSSWTQPRHSTSHPNLNMLNASTPPHLESFPPPCPQLSVMSLGFCRRASPALPPGLGAQW